MFITLRISAQVSVSTNNSAPDGSAMLDVKSTTKGMLVPRMTSYGRDSIIGPANGLLIFCTSDNSFYANSGTPALPHWQMLGSQWVSMGSDIFYNQGNVGIGISSPMAKLDVNGTISLNNQGLRLRGGGDGNHGLKYDAQAEGPYLYGWVGGALGTAGSPNSLEWNFLGDVTAKNNFYAAKFVTVDNSGINNGTFNSGLQFGPSSGEGIGSNRSGANNLYGLDFYTAGNNRMSIANAAVTVPERMRVAGNGSVGIGTVVSANSALVDMTSTDKGMLFPRMNTTQMNAIIFIN